jgi:hypothetical protein
VRLVSVGCDFRPRGDVARADLGVVVLAARLAELGLVVLGGCLALMGDTTGVLQHQSNALCVQ